MYQKQKTNNDPIELIQVIGEDGRMTAEAGKDYVGLTVEEAREKFVTYLEEQNLLEKVEDIVQNVGTSDRFGDVVEALPKTQWFVDVNKKVPSIKYREPGEPMSLKEAMQLAVNSGDIKIVPDRFEKIYFNWINNLRDWCISRQIWFGHRIPVWYCVSGEELRMKNQELKSELCDKPIVSIDLVDKCVGCGGEVRQDPDTLDTWFSSGLWTFSTLGYPSETLDLKNFHPTSVLETGYDILFFWVARMILMTTYTLGVVPFKTVYLHGLVRDEKGKKMSKSLGNIIDPLDMIEKYGTDATRLSLLLGNTPGNDMKLSEEKIAGFRNFTNKLWNISRFMLLNIENPKIDVDLPALKTDADKWIVSKLNNLISNVSKHIEENNFSYAGERLRDFTWGELADWYLEVAKIEEGKTDILNFILNSILKLWHPYVPFVTEAIWKEVYGDGALLMIQKWPVASSELNQTESSVDNFELFRKIISSIRQFRADYRIAPSSKIEVHMSAGKFAKLLMENSMLIAESTGMFSFQAKEKLKKPENTISFVVEGMEIYVLMFGFNVEKEKTRITKELEEAQKYSDVLENKLSNEQFVNNAPEAVVRVEKEKLQAQKEKIEKLKEQLKQLL
jgi:valyl-tRNA synthetase